MEVLDHPALIMVRELTQGTEFEGNLYLVGGAVRDWKLGIGGGTDFDLVTECDSGDLAELLHRKGSRDIGPPQIFARYGTAMVMVLGVPVELVTARKESYAADSRKPDTEPGSLLDDARRRDFTLNSLMVNLHSRELVDLLGIGAEDLAGGILRTPLEPGTTFSDDPLRMLRAIRFKHRFGFEFAPGLAEAIAENSYRLAIVSMERIRDEFEKILMGSRPDVALQEMRELGLLRGWGDDLETMVGVGQGKWHKADVWGHSLEVLANASVHEERDVVLRLAALLHDVGKPATRFVDENGDIRFFGHESIGADLAHDLCLRWRFSGETADSVALLVRNHMRVCGLSTLSKPAARRIVRDLGEQLENWFRLIDADAGALREGVRALDVQAVRSAIEELGKVEPPNGYVSPLSGGEIMEILEIEAGREVGELKKRLENLVLDGEISVGDKESAKKALLMMHRNRPNS